MACELLSYLPEHHGKEILLVTTGPSSFTESLAKAASHVTTAFLNEGDEQTAQEQLKNLKSGTSVEGKNCRLDFCVGSFDVVICHFYLNEVEDDEASDLMIKFLRYLRPNGHLFLVEPSASLNPVPSKRNDHFVSRTHTQYSKIIIESSITEASFQILRGKNLRTTLDKSGRYNMVCLVAKRIPRMEDNNHKALMDFTYTQSYTLGLELLFGYTFMSNGGEASTRRFCTRLGLRKDQRVLDAGCGTGGNSFFLARHYQVQVHGVDVTTNNINIAIERLGQCEPRVRDKIQFEIQDLSEANFEENQYDVIHCRDIMFHVPGKSKVFAKFYKWLKPGGLLFLTDFCNGNGSPPDKYEKYLEIINYSGVTLDAYVSLFKSAGFRNVKAEDMEEYVKFLRQQELEHFLTIEEQFVSQHSRDIYDFFKEHNWTDNGGCTWVSFTATK